MNAIEMKNVTKIFGTFKANDNINLSVKRNEIHAILGENGAGKSTLMNNLFGLYQIDGGEIIVDGEVVEITDPNKAKQLGIGMVHQHFMLVRKFTIFENIILGKKVDKKKARKKLEDLINKYNFKLDIDDYIENLTVGQEQKVEILKVLFDDTSKIIFDEPTAVLTPVETEEFLNIMKLLKDEGKTLIIITHKLKEIKTIADRCTIIRLGKTIKTVDVGKTSEKELANMMVGKELDLDVKKSQIEETETILRLRNLSYINEKGIEKLSSIDMDIEKGKILGVAGVDNNGQKELADILAGVISPTSGKVEYKGEEEFEDLSKKSIRARSNGLISYIPEDRIKEGLVGEYSILENSVLIEHHKTKFSKLKFFLNKQSIDEHGTHIIEKYDVRSAYGKDSKVKGLSGGNQQKLIIGRTIEMDCDIIIAYQPTRGVDVSAIKFIHDALIEQRDKGKTIILISMELNEIMSLSDEIAVMHDGHLIDKIKNENITRNDIGLMMAGKKVTKYEK